MTNEDKILQILVDLQKDIAEVKHDITEVKQEAVLTNIKIENEITKRLDALMDGYILNHEETTELKKRVEALETKVG